MSNQVWMARTRSRGEPSASVRRFSSSRPQPMARTSMFGRGGRRSSNDPPVPRRSSCRSRGSRSSAARATAGNPSSVTELVLETLGRERTSSDVCSPIRRQPSAESMSGGLIQRRSSDGKLSSRGQAPGPSSAVLVSWRPDRPRPFGVTPPHASCLPTAWVSRSVTVSRCPSRAIFSSSATPKPPKTDGVSTIGTGVMALSGTARPTSHAPRNGPT